MRRIPQRTSAIYLVIGALWILFSDYALLLLTKNNHLLFQTLQTYKGWFFILITALLLFFLLRSQVRQMESTEEQYRLLADNALDIVYRVRRTPDTRFEYISPSVEQISGFTPQDFYSNPYLIRDIVEPEDFEMLMKLVEHPESRTHIRLRGRHKDGSMIWTDQLCWAIYGDDGSVIGIGGIARDITALVKREDELHQLLERFRTVFDSSPLPVVVMDTVGHIQEWNRAAERVFGWSTEEATGQVLGTLVGSPKREFDEAFAMIRSGKDMVGHEIIRKRKDGASIVLVVSSASLHNSAGEVTGVLSIFEDITELRQSQQERDLLETQLMHSQRLDSIGQFTGSIAHDFNNLLAAIQMNASLMENQSDGSDSFRENIQEILSTSEKAADLTRRLLNFSRREETFTSPLDLDRVVADTLPLLSHLLGKKYKIETSFHGALPQIDANDRQLEQILMNLALNARDAMPNGGVLRFITTMEKRPQSGMEQTSTESGEGPTLIVEDTRKGMDAVTQSRIFEPFFTTKNPGQGTGLGLATVHSIVESWGGLILVESAVGKGSRFKVIFPPAFATQDHIH